MDELKAMRAETDSLRSLLIEAEQKSEAQKDIDKYLWAPDTPRDLYRVYYTSVNENKNFVQFFDPTTPCGELCETVKEIHFNWADTKFAYTEGIGNRSFRRNPAISMINDSLAIISFFSSNNPEGIYYTESTGTLKAVKRYNKWFISNEQKSWLE